MNVVVHRQNLRLSGREFWMRVAVKKTTCHPRSVETWVQCGEAWSLIEDSLTECKFEAHESSRCVSPLRKRPVTPGVLRLGFSVEKHGA